MGPPSGAPIGLLRPHMPIISTVIFIAWPASQGTHKVYRASQLSYCPEIQGAFAIPRPGRPGVSHRQRKQPPQQREWGDHPP